MSAELPAPASLMVPPVLDSTVILLPFLKVCSGVCSAPTQQQHQQEMADAMVQGSCCASMAAAAACCPLPRLASCPPHVRTACSLKTPPHSVPPRDMQLRAAPAAVVQTGRTQARSRSLTSDDTLWSLTPSCSALANHAHLQHGALRHEGSGEGLVALHGAHHVVRHDVGQLGAHPLIRLDGRLAACVATAKSGSVQLAVVGKRAWSAVCAGA